MGYRRSPRRRRTQRLLIATALSTTPVLWGCPDDLVIGNPKGGFFDSGFDLGGQGGEGGQGGGPTVDAGEDLGQAGDGSADGGDASGAGGAGGAGG